MSGARQEIQALLESLDRDFCGSTSQTIDAKLDWLMEAMRVVLDARAPVGTPYGYCSCGRHRTDQCPECVALSSEDRG